VFIPRREHPPRGLMLIMGNIKSELRAWFLTGWTIW
jgi:hypothetical protein